MKRWRYYRDMMVIISTLALALSGCTTLSAPKPGPDAAANDPGVLAIQSAGDLGALGCALIAIELTPAEVEQARLAIMAAQSVLTDPAPSVTALATALAATDVPPRYAILSAIVIQRVKVRLAGADLIPVDTVAYGIAESFVDACRMALG